MNLGRKKIFNLIFFDRFIFRILILFLSIFAALFGLALPYYQKNFSTQLDTTTLVICVGLSFGYLIFNQLTLFIGQSESVKAQKKLAETLYTHQLKLNSITLQTQSVGEVVSLYTSDVPSLTVWLEQSLPYGLTTLFPLILTPVFLDYFYDLPILFSYGLVGVLIFFNGLMAYRQSSFFYKFKKLAAERMGLVNEWIQNIRGLKILNWIEGFENKIIKKRREETLNRLAMVTNGQVMNAVSSSITFWLNLSVLSFFIWFSDRELSKPDLIVLLWVTTVFLSRPLRQLPWFFTFVFDAWTSFKRLADFLNIQNLEYQIKDEKQKKPETLLEVENLNLTLGEKNILKNINLTVGKSELIAVIGQVGSGKTLLVKSLIKDTPFVAEQFFKAASSYAPQEHFIMSATLRDNINFSYQSDEKNDSNIIHHLKKAQFDFELDRIENGLETVVGERGVNLSGGQKQRVSLARQLMRKEKLILLDDPLSAIDITTEKELVGELIKLKDSGSSIILTTQRFSILSECDRIIYMNEGSIEYDGSSEKFLNAPQYASFLTGLA